MREAAKRNRAAALAAERGAGGGGLAAFLGVPKSPDATAQPTALQPVRAAAPAPAPDGAAAPAVQAAPPGVAPASWHGIETWAMPDVGTVVPSGAGNAGEQPWHGELESDGSSNGRAGAPPVVQKAGPNEHASAAPEFWSMRKRSDSGAHHARAANAEQAAAPAGPSASEEAQQRPDRNSSQRQASGCSDAAGAASAAAAAARRAAAADSSAVNSAADVAPDVRAKWASLSPAERRLVRLQEERAVIDAELRQLQAANWAQLRAAAERNRVEVMQQITSSAAQAAALPAAALPQTSSGPSQHAPSNNPLAAGRAQADAAPPPAAHASGSVGAAWDSTRELVVNVKNGGTGLVHGEHSQLASPVSADAAKQGWASPTDQTFLAMQRDNSGKCVDGGRTPSVTAELARSQHAAPSAGSSPSAASSATSAAALTAAGADGQVPTGKSKAEPSQDVTEAQAATPSQDISEKQAARVPQGSTEEQTATDKSAESDTKDKAEDVEEFAALAQDMAQTMQGSSRSESASDGSSWGDAPPAQPPHNRPPLANVKSDGGAMEITCKRPDMPRAASTAQQQQGVPAQGQRVDAAAQGERSSGSLQGSTARTTQDSCSVDLDVAYAASRTAAPIGSAMQLSDTSRRSNSNSNSTGQDAEVQVLQAQGSIALLEARSAANFRCRFELDGETVRPLDKSALCCLGPSKMIQSCTAQ